MRLTFFQTKYGMPFGPGAEEGEDLLSGSLISSLVRWSPDGSCDRHPLEGRGSFDGKKGARRALLMVTGSEAPGREGNVFLLAMNCLAVQMFWVLVLARKSAQ